MSLCSARQRGAWRRWQRWAGGARAAPGGTQPVRARGAGRVDALEHPREPRAAAGGGANLHLPAFPNSSAPCNNRQPSAIKACGQEDASPGSPTLGEAGQAGGEFPVKESELCDFCSATGWGAEKELLHLRCTQGRRMGDRDWEFPKWTEAAGIPLVSSWHSFAADYSLWWCTSVPSHLGVLTQSLPQSHPFLLLPEVKNV